jgi:O-antigen/teichoic acid export membrane protein
MKGISFVMLPITARFLTTEAFGYLDVLLTALNVGSLVIGFGLVEGFYRKAGKDKGNLNALAANTYSSQTVIALIFLLISLFLLLVSQQLLPDFDSLNVALVFAILFISSFINIPLAWLRLTDNAASFFWLTSSKAILQAVTTWVFLHAGWGVTGVLLSSLMASTYLAVLLFLFQFRKTTLNFHVPTFKQLSVYGWPLVISGLALFISAGAERWLLAGIVSPKALASYAIAMQFAMMVAFLSEPFTHWWFPKRFSILRDTHGLQRTAFFALLASHLGISLAIGISLIAPVAIELLFPERYFDSQSLVPWLCLGMALKHCSHVLNTGCYDQKRPTIILKINLLVAVFAILIYTVSSINFGLMGVVSGFVIINAARCLLFLFASQSLIPLPYKYPLLVANLLTLLIVCFLPDQPIVQTLLFCLFCPWALILHLLSYKRLFHTATLVEGATA